jgi:hypothetical protein
MKSRKKGKRVAKTPRDGLKTLHAHGARREAAIALSGQAAMDLGSVMIRAWVARRRAA